MVACGDHELGGQIDRAGIEGLGGVAAAPALRGIVITARLERHAHRHGGALGNQVKAGLLRFGVVEVVPVAAGGLLGHGDYS